MASLRAHTKMRMPVQSENDTFDLAANLAEGFVWEHGGNTVEAGEPMPSAGTVHRTVWFKRSSTAAKRVTVTVDIQAQDRSTPPAVQVTLWAGTSLGSLTELATGYYTASANVAEGQQVYVQVGSTEMTGGGFLYISEYTQADVSSAGVIYYYMKVKFNSVYIDHALNGGWSFGGSLITEWITPEFYGQAIRVVKNSGDSNYRWGVDYSNGGFRFGSADIVADTYYELEMRHDPFGVLGSELTSVKLDGVQTDFDITGIFDTVEPGDEARIGQFDMLTSYKGIVTIDAVKIGTSDWRSTEILDADFASAIVPPFDSLVDTASEVSVSGGTMIVNLPGGTSTRDGYAAKAH